MCVCVCVEIMCCCYVLFWNKHVVGEIIVTSKDVTVIIIIIIIISSSNNIISIVALVLKLWLFVQEPPLRVRRARLISGASTKRKS